VQRITGKTVGEFFKEEIASPLNADFHIGFGKELDFRVADLIPAPPPNLFQRIFFKFANIFLKNSVLMKTFASMIVIDIPQLNMRDWRAAEIPAANGHGNARSIAKIGAVLVNGGELNGVRIISRKAIEKSIEEQISCKDLILRFPVRFGLGWGLMNEHVRDLMEINLGPKGFFWGGYGGSLCIMDPDMKLCMAFAMNKLNPEILGDSRTKGLMNILGKIIH
jgi:CubicO group peptidase (beta-lactamase class C family)